MELSERLRCIADMVNGIRVLADVGTDHAYLPIRLLFEQRIERAIVTDIAEGPLNTAKKNIQKAGFEHLCSARLGNGLSPLKIGEAECIIMAGMGGIMIADILAIDEEKAKRAKYIILQPMQHKAYLRGFLNENGYFILEERIVADDGKFYEIIKAKEGVQRKFNNLELEIGFAMKRDRAYKQFLDNKIEKINQVIVGRKKSRMSFETLEYEAFIEDIECFKNQIKSN